jgi:hypothetical protein
MMLSSPSGEWVKWMSVHQTQYDGMIHWSAHEFGRQKQKLQNVKAKCRELLVTHPWFCAVIYVLHKEDFKRNWLAKHGRQLKKSEVSRALWKNMGVSFLNTVVPHFKQLVPEDPFGCLNVRNVVINNPKGGSRQEIGAIFQDLVGRSPAFVPAGHPGIDALDGLLWAFHRCMNLGKFDCVPMGVQSLYKELNVWGFGLSGGTLVRLDSVSAMDNFRKGQH